ncbi:hypothetical protein TNCV_3685401 [Trichonephila clavipes]|nr:hypothetical protein TNCV_3685401 [Trichonephila clavipes]
MPQRHRNTLNSHQAASPEVGGKGRQVGGLLPSPDVLSQNCGGTKPNCILTYMMLKATANDSTTRLKQNDCQLSGQLPVKAVQSDQKLKRQLERLWRPYFWVHMGFCLMTILRKAKQLIVNIARHYWIN